MAGVGGGGRGLPRAHWWAAALPGSPRPTAAPKLPVSPRLPRPRITRAPPVLGSALPTPTSAGPHGRSGLGGLLGAQWAAHRPTWRCCPYPILERARQSGQHGTELQAEGGGVAGAGCGAAGPPELGPARCFLVASEGCGAGAAGRWPEYPAREAVRLPPLVPAAGCDRPGEVAAAFCRAGPARSAAAWPGRAGPPRPAGVPAAVIPPPVPPPGSLGAPPTTLPLAAPPGPMPPDPGSIP